MIIIITSKSIQTLTNYYDTIERINMPTTSVITEEDEDCIRNIEINLAKSIIYDLDITSSRRLANIILSAIS